MGRWNILHNTICEILLSSVEMSNEFTKSAVYDICKQKIAEKIDVAESTIKSAQEAANAETKSSMGDKYETTRAMMQREIAHAQSQLAEARRLESALIAFDPNKKCDTVEDGALVKTSLGLLFFLVAMGRIEVAGENIMTLSSGSPISKALWGKKSGDQVSFNGKDVSIESIL